MRSLTGRRRPSDPVLRRGTAVRRSDRISMRLAASTTATAMSSGDDCPVMSARTTPTTSTSADAAESTASRVWNGGRSDGPDAGGRRSGIPTVCTVRPRSTSGQNRGHPSDPGASFRRPAERCAREPSGRDRSLGLDALDGLGRVEGDPFFDRAADGASAEAEQHFGLGPVRAEPRRIVLEDGAHGIGEGVDHARHLGDVAAEELRVPLQHLVALLVQGLALD